MKRLLISILKPNKKKNLTEAQSIELLQRLKHLFEHGFTLYESFQFLNLHFIYRDKNISKIIIESIQAGGTCYEVLKMIGYPEIILTQVKFAEQYGNLEVAMADAIEYMRRNLKAKKAFLKTIQYPIVLISIFLFMLIVLNMTVIPQFQQLYATMNVQLSTLQNILTVFITKLPAFVLLLTFCSIVIYIIIYKLLNKIPINKKIKYIVKIPFVNSYYKIFRTYQISNELSLFYKNGISLQHIVHIYRNEQNNEFFKYLGDYLLKSIDKGMSLPSILNSLKCFQPDLIKFIEQGEKSGKLDIELKLYSQMLLHHFEDKVLKQTKFIQPVIFFILGLFIVSLYLVIMLPMFELMQTIK